MEYQSGAVSPVESISEGWNIIKGNYWLFFGMTFLALIILFAAAMIFGFVNNLISAGIALAFGAAAQNTGDAGKTAAAIIPQLIASFIGIFTNIIVATISGALFCGIYSALARQADSGTAEFGDLFTGFQKIMPCLIVAVVMSIIQFVVGAVFIVGGAAVGISAFGLGMFTKNGQIDPAVFGGLFLVIMVFVIAYTIFSLILSALTSFTYPLITDRNLSGGQALLLSAKSGLANIGGMILLLILLGLMAFGGALLCLVGIFFVMPVISAALFAAFRRVFVKGQDFRQYNPPAPPNFGQQGGY
ncbi:MAG: hypothetical protein ABIP06_04935 [Pyrinomonadaceae bacterium]